MVQHRVIRTDYDDLTGYKFGALTVLRMVRKFKAAPVCITLCTCGNTRAVKAAALVNGKIKRCVLCPSAPGTARVDEMKALFKQFLKQAKVKNLHKFGPTTPFTYEQWEALVLGICAYCGQPPYEPRAVPVGNAAPQISRMLLNGIDRVDSSLGYAVENCVSCCKTCNRMKMALPLSSFQEHIKKIYLNICEK